MSHRLLFLGLVCALGFSNCRWAKRLTGTNQHSNVDHLLSPLPANLRRGANESASKMVALQGVAPVRAAVLARFLPTQVFGLPCDPPIGADASGPLVAPRTQTTCHKTASSDRFIRINLCDQVRNQLMLAPLRSLGDNTFDDGQMLIEPIKVDQMVGLFRYQRQDQRARFEALIADRYLVSIEGQQVTIDETRALEKLPLQAKLATFAAKPEELLSEVPEEATAAKEVE